MFREMRRKNQQLSAADSAAVLERGTAGVLAVHGEDGYPYAVPLSYVYTPGKLYFHSALAGHKIDALRKDAKASFCVIDQDRIVPEKFTTYFRSVIAFGTVRILETAAEKQQALMCLGLRYAPEDAAGCRQEIAKAMSRTAVLEFVIKHTTGKEAIELVQAKKQG